jgi:hypothetical protein
MSRERTEELLEQAKVDIKEYLEEVNNEGTLAEAIAYFFPTPGYGRDIFGWAFWDLVNKGEIEYARGEVRVSNG